MTRGLATGGRECSELRKERTTTRGRNVFFLAERSKVGERKEKKAKSKRKTSPK